MRALALLLVLAACSAAREEPRPSTVSSAADAGAQARPRAVSTTADAAPAPGRPLTPGEVAMVRPLFGASVDYAAVRVVDGKFFTGQPDDVFMTPDGNLYAPGDLYHDDFAGSDSYYRGVFVHEMTHVWQHQSGVDVLGEAIAAFAEAGGDYVRAYAYRLERGRDLLDFNHEQQASIVEDYFRIRWHDLDPIELVDPPTSRNARDRLYAAVLARFLADPTYLRARRASGTLSP